MRNGMIASCLAVRVRRRCGWAVDALLVVAMRYLSSKLRWADGEARSRLFGRGIGRWPFGGRVFQRQRQESRRGVDRWWATVRLQGADGLPERQADPARHPAARLQRVR